MSILFCAVFFSGLALFIIFLSMTIMKSKKYLIFVFFGCFIMVWSLYFYTHSVEYGYYLYKKIIDTTYELETWKNNNPELIEKLEKFIEYKELMNEENDF